MRYFDKESAKLWVFLINNLEIPVLNVVKLYKNRWQIELFLKRIKRHLRIKHYFGTSSQCGEVPGLDGGGFLPNGGRPSPAAPTTRKASRNHPAFEPSVVLEGAYP
ncbi:MAG: transposase [Verrucomicrobiota bacterium]